MTVVTVWIHLDNLSQEGIMKINRNSEILSKIGFENNSIRARKEALIMSASAMCCGLNRYYRPAKAFLILAVIVLMSLTSALPALAEEETPGQNELEFFLQFNLWAPDIKMETTFDKDIKIDIDEIVENLEFAYMGTIGASKGKWTFLADVIYLNLDHSDNYTLVDNPLVRLDLTDIELTAWIATPMVVYNVLELDQVTLGLLAGARYLHLKVETETTQRILLTTTESSDSNSGDAWNGIVGVRGNIYLPGKWYMPYFFDVGTGDTELTWQAFAGVAYKFDRIGLSLGYRHLEWELDDGDAGGDLIDQLYISGPMIGIKYWF